MHLCFSFTHKHDIYTCAFVSMKLKCMHYFMYWNTQLWQNSFMSFAFCFKFILFFHHLLSPLHSLPPPPTPTISMLFSMPMSYFSAYSFLLNPPLLLSACSLSVSLSLFSLVVQCAQKTPHMSEIICFYIPLTDIFHLA